MSIAPSPRQAFLAAGGALVIAEAALVGLLMLLQARSSGKVQSFSVQWAVVTMSAQLVAPLVLTYGAAAVWLLGAARRLSLRSLLAVNALAAGLFSYYAAFDPETATFGLGGGFGILVVGIFAYAAVLAVFEWLILSRWPGRRAPAGEGR